MSKKGPQTKPQRSLHASMTEFTLPSFSESPSTPASSDTDSRMTTPSPTCSTTSEDPLSGASTRSTSPTPLGRTSLESSRALDISMRDLPLPIGGLEAAEEASPPTSFVRHALVRTTSSIFRDGSFQLRGSASLEEEDEEDSEPEEISLLPFFSHAVENPAPFATIPVMVSPRHPTRFRFLEGSTQVGHLVPTHELIQEGTDAPTWQRNENPMHYRRPKSAFLYDGQTTQSPFGLLDSLLPDPLTPITSADPSRSSSAASSTHNSPKKNKPKREDRQSPSKVQRITTEMGAGFNESFARKLQILFDESRPEGKSTRSAPVIPERSLTPRFERSRHSTALRQPIGPAYARSSAKSSLRPKKSQQK